jgi:hypothetical protein
MSTYHHRMIAPLEWRAPGKRHEHHAAGFTPIASVFWSARPW